MVKIHYVPGLYGAPLFVAADKGFFDQAGIKVDMKPTTAVTKVVPFLSTGQIDVATGGYGAGIFSAISNGINIRIIAPMAITPKDRVPSGLMVRKNSGINNHVKWLDNRGALQLVAARLRHVASSNWSSRNYLNMSLLNGIDLDSVA